MKKPTIAELQTKIALLEPYQEAFFCLRRGEEPVTITCEDRSATVVGLARMTGGVVIEINGEPCAPFYVSSFTATYAHSPHDPYMADVARQITRLQRVAVEARYAAKVEP